MLQKPKLSGLTLVFLKLIPRRMAGSRVMSFKSPIQPVPMYIALQQLHHPLRIADPANSRLHQLCVEAPRACPLSGSGCRIPHPGAARVTALPGFHPHAYAHPWAARSVCDAKSLGSAKLSLRIDAPPRFELKGNKL